LKKAPQRSFVYVLGCHGPQGPRTYVGWTNDIARRVRAHNAGKGARSTRGRAWHLLYVEYFDHKPEAMRREYFLKQDRKLRKKLAAGLSFLTRAS